MKTGFSGKVRCKDQDNFALQSRKVSCVNLNDACTLNSAGDGCVNKYAKYRYVTKSHSTKVKKKKKLN